MGKYISMGGGNGAGENAGFAAPRRERPNIYTASHAPSSKLLCRIRDSRAKAEAEERETIRCSTVLNVLAVAVLWSAAFASIYGYEAVSLIDEGRAVVERLIKAKVRELKDGRVRILDEILHDDEEGCLRELPPNISPGMRALLCNPTDYAPPER